MYTSIQLLMGICVVSNSGLCQKVYYEHFAHVFLWKHIFISLSGTARSQGTCMSNFTRNCQFPLPPGHKMSYCYTSSPTLGIQPFQQSCQVLCLHLPNDKCRSLFHTFITYLDIIYFEVSIQIFAHFPTGLLISLIDLYAILYIFTI